MKLILTEEERSTLSNACYVANEQFRKDIQFLHSEPYRASHARLIKQFELQIAQTTAILEKVESL